MKNKWDFKVHVYLQDYLETKKFQKRLEWIKLNVCIWESNEYSGRENILKCCNWVMKNISIQTVSGIYIVRVKCQVDFFLVSLTDHTILILFARCWQEERLVWYNCILNLKHLYCWFLNHALSTFERKEGSAEPMAKPE